MKLDHSSISKLNNILNVCSLGGIDAIIIENGCARGINQDRSCVIISDYEIPSFGEQKVGLTRLTSLKSRLDLFLNENGVVLEAKETDRGEISQLEILAKRNKVQFRCTSPALIKAPRSVNDADAFLVKISKEQMQLLFNAIKVMGTKRVALIVKKDKSISAQIADSNNDNFNITFDEPVDVLDDQQDDTAVHYFSTDVFISVLKAALANNDFIEFVIGGAGTIKSIVSGHQVIILPKVGED